MGVTIIANRLKAVPLSREQAKAFITELHRHHAPSLGEIFRLGAEVDGRLVGVAQVGRPVSPQLDNGCIIEVTRLCTDGTKNACSFLYSRAARVARELGYAKIITYILASECGGSLRAAGWHKEADVKGKSWNHASRQRSTAAPTCDKQRWTKELIP
jgi:hypothetical protein